MTIARIARMLRALTPAEKMELADRLYDDAAREAEAANAGGRRRRPEADERDLAAGRPALDPWAGFTERLRGRVTVR